MQKIITFILCLTILAACKQHLSSQAEEDTMLPDDLVQIGVMLDSIHNVDQNYRINMKEVASQYGWDAEQVKNLWTTMRKTDSSNLVFVRQVLDSHGWLSADQIGHNPNSTLFLVIQHSNQETQEQYLPMMRQAVKDGKARSQSLALLEDRVALGKGELQTYGSQLGTDKETGGYYLRPLKDPDTVNDRRAAVGLGTIEEYIWQWDLVWDVEEYKIQLPKVIEKEKQKAMLQ